MMRKIMQILLLSCLKASKLIEKKQLFGLNIVEKAQLHVHKSMCKACTLYEKQSLIVYKLLQTSHLNIVVDNDTLQNLKADTLKKIKV